MGRCHLVTSAGLHKSVQTAIPRQCVSPDHIVFRTEAFLMSWDAAPAGHIMCSLNNNRTA